ncbi:pilus assembly protein TadG-related protein [Sulfobacillus thermosulfidooxidans]|uniref:pilus assembly protein TadG-related protein n=1 Tax=Sulfobacillus thermosulfidooxidans TaxID=28034 RepID=UPI001494F6E9|nr:pilus assembly protein TadG-related protein [Sulfobacillus thermosulfidooxidans]
MRDTKGQSLPIVILFMGLIIGAAAITIDYGKVSALRNQAQSASSAAALAAAQTLAAEINGEVSSSNSNTQGYVNVPLTNPTTVAQKIYQENIKSAIAHSNSLNTCTVTYYIGSLNPQDKVSSNPSSIQLGINSPIYVQVTSSGTTTMNFGSALGIGSANITPKATAAATIQFKISNGLVLPLLLPVSNPLSSTGNWQNYWRDGEVYAAYRGDGSGNVPSWTTGIASTNIIAYHKSWKSLGDGCSKSAIFGDGGFGWYNNNEYASLQVGEVIKGKAGSNEWQHALASINPGQTVVLPVAYPHSYDQNTESGNKCPNDSAKTVEIYGFVTATIDSVHDTHDSVNNMNNTNGEPDVGFSFTIDHRYAVSSTLSSNNTTNLSLSYTAYLVPNNG